MEASILDLKLSIVDEYCDMILHGSSSTDDVIAESLIVKAKNWDGAFIDVMEIPYFTKRCCILLQ